jgi:uncharacterized protein YjdB
VATVDATTGVVTGVSAGTATMTYTVTGTGGCPDGTATRTVTVNQTSASTISQTICAPNTYSFNGQLLSASGTYTATLTNAASCDSVITLNLTVINVQITSQPTASISLIAGASGTLSVVAVDATSYQWQQSNGGGIWTNLSNGTNYSGVTTSTLGIVADASMNGLQFRVVVSNSICSSVNSDVSTLVIATQATLASVTTTLISSITSNSASTGGNVTADGSAFVSSRGVAYGIGQNPTISGSTTSNGTGTGIFTSSLSSLVPSTLYYVRAYATNSVGTAYGNQESFTTLAPPVVPQVSTTSISSITSTGASTGGNVTTDGGASVTARGVAYGTSQNPSVSGTTTSNGTGTGTFTSTLSGLSPSTNYNVRAYATNSVGTAYGSQLNFTTLAPPAVLPTVTTTIASSVTSTGASTGGNVTADGGASVTARGVAYGTGQNPTISGPTTSNGTGTGIFTSILSGLSPSTLYNVRAYATNSVGTAYGSQINFTTQAPPATLPTLTTTVASSISSTGASTGGTISADGGAAVTARGVAYGTGQNPTISGTTTSNGTGTGTFTSTLTGLTPATAYNVRAYATNTVGTAYGNQISFTTLFPASVLPTVTTDAATSITSTGATTGGHVTSDGGVAVLSRGVAYSTNQNPTTSNSTTNNGSGIGTFTSQLQGLAPLTTYFARAYATNSVGTSYGNQITWTTNAPSGMVVALGQATACSGNVITVPITVQNFINIGAVSLDIEYDSTALTYIGFNSPGLSGNLIVNNPSPGGTPIGRVLVSWFSLTPSNLNNGLMMNLRFTANKTTPLTWNTSVAGQCELADANGDVITDVVFANGRFTALNAQITAQPSPNISIASGLTGTLSVSATGVSAYQWQINSGGGNWTNLSNGGGYSGVTTSTLGILASQNMDGSQYRVVLSSDSCTAETSGVSTLSIITLVLPSITTTPATSVTTTSANTGGNVTSDGGASVTARGVAYASTQNPTLAGLFTSNGSGTGSFVSTISGLTPATTYHVRAYATNSVGTEYGNQISFTTQSPQIQIPTLTTTAVTSISLSGAVSGGNITSDGGAAVTSRGLAFGTAPNPTTSGTRTSNGSGTGVFTSILTGLSSSTLYYLRAYATNSAGTAYGNQLTFTTLSPVPVLPSVSTDAASAITSTEATTGGNVTSDGGSAVSTRGVAYGLSINPTTLGLTTSDGSGLGSFTSDLVGLTPSTTYYVRAYATNSVGTAYGNNENFTTNPPTGTVVSLGQASGCNGTTISIPITVQNFSNIGAVSLEINYDSTALVYTRFDSSGFGPGTLIVNNPTSGGVPLGRILVSWFSLTPTTIGNGLMMNLVFRVNGSTTLEFNTAVAGQCELADENGEIIQDVVFSNGLATSRNAVIVDQPQQSISLTNGATGSLSISVNGASTYQWQVNTGGGTWADLRDGSDYSGVTTSILSIVASSTMNGNQYRVIITGGGCPDVTSNSSTLTIVTGSLPSLTTNVVTAITSSGATTGGDVTADGGLSVTAKGVAYDTGLNPTISGASTIDGVGRGAFVSLLTGLNPSTNYYVRAYATNSLGTAYGNQESFTTLNTTGVLPSVSTELVTSITVSEATTGGAVLSEGDASVTTRGVAYGIAPNPTISGTTTSDGAGLGAFVSLLSGLSPATDYFVRAYATSSLGTSYGNEETFTTQTPVLVLPSVTTASVSSITSSTAITGGDVISDGGAVVSARGVVYGTTTTPTIAGLSTNDGTGSGAFISSLTGLNPTTTYYVRAYATNSVGTSYGNLISFTTLLPTGSLVVSAQSVQACAGTIVGVPITLTSFDSVSAFQIVLEYNSQYITYTSFTSVSIPNLQVFPQPSLGRITLLWSGAAGSLSINQNLCELEFLASNPSYIRFNSSQSTVLNELGNAVSGVVYQNTTYQVSQPIFPGVITGNSSLCAGGNSVYSSSVSGGLWSSSNPAIFTVNATTGVVTAVAPGTANLLYSKDAGAPCGISSATFAISVVAPPVAGTLSGNQAICVGSSAAFTSTANGGTWRSSNPAVASVNTNTGLVSAVSSGTATITYTVPSSAAGCADASASIVVTITALPSAGVISGSTELCVGSMSLFSSTIPGGLWTSSNPAVATVNSSTGEVMGTSAGSASITYTVPGSGGCPSASANRLVNVSTPPSAGVLGGVQEVCAGNTVQFTSTAVGGVWSSSNSALATINPSSGLITAIGAGVVNITYTVSGTGGCANAIGTRSLTITAQPTAGTLSGNQNLCVGSTDVFASTVTGGVWSSSNSAIATVNAATGLVTAVAPGTVSITYSVAASGGCSGADATRSVVVSAAPISGTLSGNQTICVGSTSAFTSTIAGGSWTSSNPAIASVNATTGLVTGVAAGTAIITYTVLGSGGCTSATSTRTITINAGTNAGILGGTQSICVNNNTAWTSTVLGGVWSSGNAAVATVNATSGVVTGVSAGTAIITYTVSGTGGCADATASRTITVTAAPIAGVLSGNQTICAGSSSPFSSSVGGGSWSSSNPAVATVNASTGLVNGISGGTATITYTVTGTGGCSDATATRTITVNPRPAAPLISLSPTSDTLFSSVSAGVQWSRNGQAISGASGSTLVISQNGIYRAVVVDANGCISDSSNAINVTNVLVPGMAFEGLSLYPNPSSGHIWIQFQTPDETSVHWSLLNSIGQVVRTDRFDHRGDRPQRLGLDFSDLAEGIYTIRLEQLNRVGQIKCVIQR